MNANLGKGFVLTTNDDRSNYSGRIAYIADLIWSLNVAPSRILPKVAPIYVNGELQLDRVYFVPECEFVGRRTIDDWKQKS